MTTALITYAQATVVEAERLTLVSRTKARVAAQSAAFCGDQSSNVWFPVAPGATQPAAPAPTTNASPAPPNSVALPPGFDPTDTCYIFQDLLPLSTAPVYAEELEPSIILEPYSEIVPLLGITVASLSIREYPYELTLPGESIAAVIRTIIQIPTYLLSLEADAFTATGQAASLKHNRKVIGAAGAFTLTGQNADRRFPNIIMPANVGVFSLTGNNAVVLYERLPLSAGNGSFTFTGYSADSLIVTALRADTGQFLLTGNTASKVKDYVINSDSGAYSLVGQSATLTGPARFEPVTGTAAPLLGASEATSTTGWTTLLSFALSDDVISTGQMGFTFTLASVGYSLGYISTNSFFTFGGLSYADSGFSSSNPNLRKIFFYPGYRTITKIYRRLGTTSFGNKFASYRVEASSSVPATTTNIIYEFTFFQVLAGDQYIEVRFGNSPVTSSLFGIYNESSSYATATSTQNTSWVFKGNSTGTSWTLTDNQYFALLA